MGRNWSCLGAACLYFHHMDQWLCILLLGVDRRLQSFRFAHASPLPEDVECAYADDSDSCSGKSELPFCSSLTTMILPPLPLLPSPLCPLPPGHEQMLVPMSDQADITPCHIDHSCHRHRHKAHNPIVESAGCCATEAPESRNMLPHHHNVLPICNCNHPSSAFPELARHHPGGTRCNKRAKEPRFEPWQGQYPSAKAKIATEYIYIYIYVFSVCQVSLKEQVILSHAS